MKKYLKTRPLAAMLCAAALAVSLLAGCSPTSSGQDPAVPAGAGDAPSEASVQEASTQAKAEEAQEAEEKEEAPAARSASQAYVEAMGHGWNLGNSFDGVNTDEDEGDEGETAWGNPVVTRELLHAVREQGFDSIRIPLTLFRRYSTGADGQCVIDEEWLARYKEVVDWAVEEGFYVMVNIHHDSWIWLKYWDGDKASEEYVRFVQMWEQLAEYLKEEPEQVCFETINEPDFEGESDEEKQKKLDAINLAAYHAIRDRGGNNSSRMIVMPTLWTNHEKCGPLLDLVQGLEDDHIIATVHYYSEWVYSANLGVTGFDDPIDVTGDADEKTARKAADAALAMVHEAFTANGIGVVVGEYGLLGYDKGEGCNQPGEELKYYEYMNELARQYGLCLMFWDNGSGISRTDSGYPWKKPLVGELLHASMSGRSSCAAGLDTLYFNKETETDVEILLTLNGNRFQEIQGLSEGTDYTWDSGRETVTLKKDYINGLLAGQREYGVLKELVFCFDSGADWHQKLVRYGIPEFGEARGTAADGLVIPVSFRGAELRRMTAYADEERTGPNSDWCRYLEHSGSYFVDSQKETLTIDKSFFDQCAEGEIRFEAEFFDGQRAEFWLEKNGEQVRTYVGEPTGR